MALPFIHSRARPIGCLGEAATTAIAPPALTWARTHRLKSGKWGRRKAGLRPPMLLRHLRRSLHLSRSLCRVRCVVIDSLRPSRMVSHVPGRAFPRFRYLPCSIVEQINLKVLRLSSLSYVSSHPQFADVRGRPVATEPGTPRRRSETRRKRDHVTNSLDSYDADTRAALAYYISPRAPFSTLLHLCFSPPPAVTLRSPTASPLS